jgi:N-acetylmuramoyl-L-alanine amidase
MKIKQKAVFFLIFWFSGTFGSAAAGERFLDLESFSAARGFQYHWDPLAKLASVSSLDQTVKFRVGSEYGLSEGRLIRLGAKTRLTQGSVQVFYSAKNYLDRLVVSDRLNAPVYHRIRRVVIDAGHGGTDTGAVSSRGLKEKRVVLDVARKVKKLLEARGLEVVMTRNSDVFIPLSERTQLANKQGADFFVSIHANASLTRSLQGFEIYYLSEATDDAALALERAENSVIRFESTPPKPSKELKTIFWDLRESENRRESLQLAERVMDAVGASVTIAARRIRSANFYVLKWTECPAILIETGYLTNRPDERRLRDPVYKRRLAESIVEGIWRYKIEYETTNGFTR